MDLLHPNPNHRCSPIIQISAGQDSTLLLCRCRLERDGVAIDKRFSLTRVNEVLPNPRAPCHR
jgi:hypothetical protein